MGARTFIVNGRFLAKPVGGVARVGRELLRALIAELRLHPDGVRLSIAAPPGAPIPMPDGDLDQSQWAETAVTLSRGEASNLGEQTLLPLHYPGATILSFCNTTPLLARRSVVWLHDTHTFDAPESYSRAFRLWQRAMLLGVRARRFEIATVSEFSRGRLIARGADPARIHVIHNGGDHLLRAPADADALRAAGLEGAPYVLVMGSPAKLKNMDFALDALMQGLDPAFKIAVVGLKQEGPYAPGGARAGDGRLAILPMLSDGRLRALYGQARAVIVPSLLEGFGLYAAEALFEGAPLALSNRGAHPEVGGEAALYFDPLDREDFLEKVRAALTPETAARLKANAARQAEKFRWRAAARRVIDLYLCSP